MKTGFQRCKRVKNAHSDLRPSRLVEEQAQVSPEGGRDPGEAGARAPRGDSHHRCAEKQWAVDPLQKGTFSLLLLVIHFNKG